LINYSTRNTTLKKGDLKDVDVVVLADGYNGLKNYALIDAYGHLYTNIFDAYGVGISSTEVSGNTGLDVYVLNPTEVTITDSYLYAEDQPHTSGDKGRMLLGIRNDNDTALTSNNLDYSGLALDAYGHIKTNLYDGYAAKLSSTTSGGKQGLDVYVLNPTLPFSLSNDTNYGTVGVSTLRTASQIGNATGAADFNRGATSAQTLRVTNNTNDGYGIAISSTVVSGKSGLDVNIISPISTTLSTDLNYGTVGANTLRTAAQIGNATGAADFNVGTIGAQTLRTASHTVDGYGNRIGSVLDALKVNFTNTTIGVTQSTSPWVVSGTVTAAEDKNYGTVGANTLRSAAQIGNSTGQADFNYGTVGAQTLRVASQIGNATGAANFNYGTVGAQTLRVASQIGNATGAADFNAGNTSAQTLRVVIATNQSAIPVTQSTSPWVISGTVTAAEDKNYGTVGANTLRVASQIGNATGAADFNVGTIGAQTLRTASHTVDGYGNRIGSVLDALKVNFTNTTIGVTQSTSPWVISGTVTAAEDKNYGTVGANTLRAAAQIGNATGAADFNFGTVGAQTLRTAAELGNASGLADFNRGATGAQTLRVTNNNNDGYGTAISSTVVSGKSGLDVNLINATIAVTQSTSPWVISGTVTAAEDKNYGTVGANTLRVASQIGNATGAADFNFGASSAQTLRTASNVADGYGNRITSSKHITQTYHGLDTWALSGTPQHFNGTVGTTAATITPTSTTTSIIVINPATNPNSALLSVSFDGGTNFTDIERRGTLSISTEVSSFQIKANAANTAYQILVTRR
jgi:hypothetical protein